MWTYVGNGINDVYPAMVQDCLESGDRVEQRGLTTRELSPVIFELENPRERLVTSFGRPVNVAFALAEVLWILAGRSDVGMLAFYNSNIKQFSDDGVRFNAAYGHRLRYAFGHDQLEDCIRTLQDDPGSRQAVLQINHPEYDRGWNLDEKHVTKDRACNVSAHMLLRDGKLNWTQFMRSNDALWGMPYNVMQWTHIQEYVASALGVDVGRYTHVSDSFHIYDPPLAGQGPLPDVQSFDLYRELGAAHAPISAGGMANMTRAELGIRDFFRGGGVLLSEDWQKHWWYILRAHCAYREHNDEEALGLLLHSEDQVYAAAQIRFYWSKRWNKSLDVESRMRTHFSSEVTEWACA